MTFGILWREDSSSLQTATPASISSRFERPSSSSDYYASDRGDAAGFTYSSGGQSKSKKAEKKQAAMSALTLIAFLFFLNILQNCLKDQQQEKAAAAAIMINPKLVLKARVPGSDDELLEEKVSPEENTLVRSRKLLSVDEESDLDPLRKRKFIHNFGLVSRDWTNELSQVTNEDLVDQKEKVEKLREFWNYRNHRNREKQQPQPVNDEKIAGEDEVEHVKVKKFVNNPVLSDTRSIPKLSQYWEKQKASTTAEPKYIDFEEPNQKVADFHEFEVLVGSSPQLSDVENSLVQNAVNRLQYSAEPTSFEIPPPPQPAFLRQETTETMESSPSAAPLVLKPKNPFGEVEEVSGLHMESNFNTPRYRRGSEEQSTKIPVGDMFYPATPQVTQSPDVPSVSSTTERTYHVYTHPSQMHSGLWRTTSTPTPRTTTPFTTSSTTTTEKFNIDSIYLTTLRPMPGRTSGSHRFPLNHKPHYKSQNRYEYSPYRRVAYEPPMVRHEYYPMSVVGQYGGDGEGPAVGLMQLLWSMVTSFARPFVNLVPNVSKVGRESAPCIELLTCEAHRFGQYMGPTAQALATTFSSVVQWMTPETDKLDIEDAMNAARENTCFKQIETCDYKSGGKSILSTLAKFMEQKSNREPKEFLGQAVEMVGKKV